MGLSRSTDKITRGQNVFGKRIKIGGPAEASGSRELKVTSKHKTPPHLHAPAALFAEPSAHLYGVFPSPHYSLHNGVSNRKPCRSRTQTARSRVANRSTEKKSSDSAARFLNSGWAAAPPLGSPPPAVASAGTGAWTQGEPERTGCQRALFSSCRFEMPYNIWCDGCKNHIGMGEPRPPFRSSPRPRPLSPADGQPLGHWAQERPSPPGAPDQASERKRAPE